MFLELIKYYVERFNDSGIKNAFLPVKSCVGKQILCGLYEKFVLDGSCVPIEQLSESKKRYYYDIVKEFYSSKEDIIKGCKAAYTLTLISGF